MFQIILGQQVLASYFPSRKAAMAWLVRFPQPASVAVVRMN